MITGYNTDVRHAEVVFHVQTEDKGTSNPFVESLVYVGGRVVAAKRASYQGLLDEGKGAGEIGELMEHQHRTMIAAIKQGKFDEKLQALLGIKPSAASTGTVPKASAAEDMLSATRITEAERTLDQVILEYLTSEAEQEQLQIAVEGEPTLIAGLPSHLHLRATSSKGGRPVSGALIEVKLISTVAEARNLASGETDSLGDVELDFLIPQLGSGAAALIITAESHIGSAELKHLL